MKKKNALPAAGDKAPLFILNDTDENPVSLEDCAGSWIVLYFYPKDNTSGCTVEANEFSAIREKFSAIGARIIGVSPDSCKSHQNFREKHHLSIELLSDPKQEILKAYGVWQKKSMYGREYYGVVRTTFIIDPRGNIVKVWEKVSAKGHAEEVFQTLQEIISRGE